MDLLSGLFAADGSSAFGARGDGATKRCAPRAPSWAPVATAST